MPFSAREVVQALSGKLQFIESNRAHRWFEREINGNVVSTEISHGAREIDDNLLLLMSRQIRITLPQFKEAVSCTFSGEQYTEVLSTVYPPEEVIDFGPPPPEGAAAAWEEFATAQLGFWNDVATYEGRLQEARVVLRRLGYTNEQIMGGGCPDSHKGNVAIRA